jgi:restriction system protein
MSPITLAITLAAALLVALLAFFGLGLNSRKRIEAQCGLASLYAMKWREFAQLVGDIMRQRGMTQVPDEGVTADAGFDRKFERGNQRYLVAIKHGAATRVGTNTLRDLRSAIATEGAGGGLVVTSGAVETAALSGLGATLEVLHGKDLWNEIAPLLPDQHKDAVRSRIKRRLTLGWLTLLIAAALAAVAASQLLQDQPHSAPDAAPPAPAPVQAEAAAEATEAPSDTPAPSTPQSPVFREVPVLTEEEADARRNDALSAVQALEGVTSADWSTRSTLVLSLASPDPDLRQLISQRVCERLVEYEELRYTRLQIQEGEGRVRWAQCQ